MLKYDTVVEDYAFWGTGGEAILTVDASSRKWLALNSQDQVFEYTEYTQTIDEQEFNEPKHVTCQYQEQLQTHIIYSFINLVPFQGVFLNSSSSIVMARA